MVQMKLRHLFLTLILAALLTVTATAYQIPNREDNTLSPYYGMNTDQEDQADFLNTLGLFHGTGQGYELNRSMNRCEAGTMLVRLLGKEAEALEENNDHPFTDVPQWADPYIGWLWKNGLTKGMDATTYGAKKSVTAEQYLIFLSRVLQGSDVADDWWETGYGSTMASLQRGLDRQGFLRGDAVSLSVWALQRSVQRDGSLITSTLSQHLIEDGVFSEDVFLTAAFPIYDSRYSTDKEGHLVRSTAYVGIIGEEAGLTLLDSSEKAPRQYLYCMREDEVNGPCLITVDCATLVTVTENVFFSNTLDELVGEQNFRYLLSHGNYDYFGLDQQVYCYDGTWFARVVCLEQPLEGFTAYADQFRQDDSILTVQNGDMVWLIDGAKAAYVPALEGSNVFDAVDGIVLAWRNTSTSTEIVQYDPSAGNLTVLSAKGAYPDVLDDGLYRIGNRLWRYTGGQLVQLAEMPILDAVADNRGGAYVMTDSTAPDIVHVSAGGAVTTALSHDCGHGLEINCLDGIRPDGSLQFGYYAEEPLGNHESTSHTYALEWEGEHPAIRVISLKYAFDAGYIYTFESEEDRDAFYEARIETEQQRLNDLGLGIS